MQKSPARFTVEELTQPVISDIARQWGREGELNSDIASILEGDGNPKISWCLVKNDANETLAVFDVRDAIAHVKNMVIIFNPKLDFNFEDQRFEAVKENFRVLLDILVGVFNHVVELSDRWGTVKIRNDSPDIATLFFCFAEWLQKKNPAYVVKFYKRCWVEITNANGGGA
ncbi:MAG: hypothetical protein FWF29_07895 [Treponema sp.]|nr:hypothetical protein [Treponema sp.]